MGHPADDRTDDPPDEAAFLAAYDPRRYPPVAVSVDMVVLTVRAGRLEVLLVRRGGHPFRGAWALPGGFVDENEDLDAAAQRELLEETGIHLGNHDAQDPRHLEQLRTYGRPGRDPRMRVISVAYVAFAPASGEPVGADDAVDARYWPVDELAIGADSGTRGSSALGFDHSQILADGVERARSKLEYTTLAAAFVTEPFTLAELRQVYEAVWGQPLHDTNFRRKVLSTPEFVQATGDLAPTDGRPAQLYRRGAATRLHPPILRPAGD